MVEILVAVMAVAAVAYVTFAGADFGAGMVEPLLPREQRMRASAAIAPVWEANHVWLVLIAVLSFVGFPRLYVEAGTYLHVPLLLVLLGIVARGAAFTFRHYDPQPGRLGPWYSAIFRLFSALTPLFLGIVAAALVDGRIGPCETDFFSCYIKPWNTWFGWATGLFVCALFAFQGVALLSAEYARGDSRALPYVRLSRRLHLGTVACGGLVFGAAYSGDSPWLKDFRGSMVAWGALGLSTLLWPLVALAFHAGRPQLLRVALAAQAAVIVCGFFAPGFPILMRIADGNHVQLPAAAAPPAVLLQLLIAVAVGLCLILPALVYLIAVYKRGGASGPG